MPQLFTTLINKTIEDPAYNPALGITSLESTSVRLVGMQAGTFVEVNGISWGAVCTSPDLNSGTLLIIRNEIFDAAFQYGNAALRSSKDVIFEDRVDVNDPAHNIDFQYPLKLDDSNNYLIIICGFTTVAVTIVTHLTVRGSFIELQTAKLWKTR